MISFVKDLIVPVWWYSLQTLCNGFLFCIINLYNNDTTGFATTLLYYSIIICKMYLFRNREGCMLCIRYLFMYILQFIEQSSELCDDIICCIVCIYVFCSSASWAFGRIRKVPSKRFQRVKEWLKIYLCVKWTRTTNSLIILIPNGI